MIADILGQRPSGTAQGDADGAGVLTPAQLREASASFSGATSSSADGWHPRHFALLEDGLLTAWSTIWSAAEATGCYPSQMAGWSCR